MQKMLVFLLLFQICGIFSQEIPPMEIDLYKSLGKGFDFLKGTLLPISNEEITKTWNFERVLSFDDYQHVHAVVDINAYSVDTQVKGIVRAGLIQESGLNSKMKMDLGGWDFWAAKMVPASVQCELSAFVKTQVGVNGKAVIFTRRAATLGVVRLDKGYINPRFIEDANSLPLVYEGNEDVYKEFIGQYGTHFVREATLGGYLLSLIVIDVSAYAEHALDINAALTATGKFLSLFSPGTTDINAAMDVGFSEEAMLAIDGNILIRNFVYGGSLRGDLLEFQLAEDNWVDTLRYCPQVIETTLGSYIDMIPNPKIANNVRQTIIDYAEEETKLGRYLMTMDSNSPKQYYNYGGDIGQPNLDIVESLGSSNYRIAGLKYGFRHITAQGYWTPMGQSIVPSSYISCASLDCDLNFLLTGRRKITFFDVRNPPTGFMDVDPLIYPSNENNEKILYRGSPSIWTLNGFTKKNTFENVYENYECPNNYVSLGDFRKTTDPDFVVFNCLHVNCAVECDSRTYLYNLGGGKALFAAHTLFTNPPFVVPYTYKVMSDANPERKMWCIKKSCFRDDHLSLTDFRIAINDTLKRGDFDPVEIVPIPLFKTFPTHVTWCDLTWVDQLWFYFSRIGLPVIGGIVLFILGVFVIAVVVIVIWCILKSTVKKKTKKKKYEVNFKKPKKRNFELSLKF